MGTSTTDTIFGTYIGIEDIWIFETLLIIKQSISTSPFWQ